MSEEKDAEALRKENIKLKEIIRLCLRARQIAHVKQIIREAFSNERSN